MRLCGRTALMGWELGGGYGHLSALRVVALELAARGFCPVFVVKDRAAAAQLLGDQSFPIVRAPDGAGGTDRAAESFRAASYADILALRGFADPERLAAAVAAWQRIIDEVDPDLIVCDHSPTLCLAAYGTRPVVVLGTGFTVPPSDAPSFPVLDPSARPITAAERMLESIRQVQVGRGRPTPAALPALLCGQARFVRTFPELDPYRAVRRDPVVGPFEQNPSTCEGAAPFDFFAYLAADYPGIEQILLELAGRGSTGQVYIRDASRPLIDLARRLGAFVHESPPPLSTVLPQCWVVLHHGGIGTSERALVAGRPQVLLPQHLEQELNAQCVESLGVGVNLGSRVTLEGLAHALDRARSDARIAQRAARLARTLQSSGPRNGLMQVVNGCTELLSGPGSSAGHAAGRQPNTAAARCASDAATHPSVYRTLEV